MTGVIAAPIAASKPSDSWSRPELPTKPGWGELQFVDRVLGRMSQMPGIHAVAAAFTSPLTGAPNRGITIEGRPVANPSIGDTADFQAVTPDFFRATGASIRRGRAFMASDDENARPVMIVNQTFADRYLAGQDPIGQRVSFGGTLTHEIVGVASDMRYRSVEAAADPTFYLPMAQNAERWPFLSFVVWSDGDPRAAIATLRSAIREADPQQAIIRARSFDEVLGAALATRRFTTTLVAAFAVTALLLAAIGTYGVMAFAVSMRTRELGVRAALGATPQALTRLVLGSGVLVLAVALPVGLAGSVVGTSLLRTMLYGVSAHDTETFVAVAMLLATVTLAATWIPARRAIAADPIRSLRDCAERY
jgi:predicted permease